MGTKNDNSDNKKTLSLSSDKLQLKKTVNSGKIRQSFSHGRTKAVEFEVKKKRTVNRDRPTRGSSPEDLSEQELEKKRRLLAQAQAEAEERLSEHQTVIDRINRMDADRLSEHERKQEEARQQAKALEEARAREVEAEKAASQPESKTPAASQEASHKPGKEHGAGGPKRGGRVSDHGPAAMEQAKPGGFLQGARLKSKKEDDDEAAAKKVTRKTLSLSTRETRQKLHGLSFEEALNDEAEEERQRSLAALKRAREKKKEKSVSPQDAGPVIREVVITELITVQELANRMAVRSVDVVKKLMSLGIIATASQSIDADTAEIVVTDFGHKFRRVADSDVEAGLVGQEDVDADLEARAPIVTIMGHVDHGKTSLLDAIRAADVVASEAGGITQHIGAYQIVGTTGSKISFIDTPGHAAFSEMRARGADVTDIVILVVAADDGIMDQTVEAINHAKAAEVPIIVALNKVDKPDANPDRVKSELLTHGLVVEEMGGDIQCVHVSAKEKTGLAELEEAILLQAEVLELTANPHREAIGAVIEARVDHGKGVVTTVLVERGTLEIGDIFVAGASWGRVRALINDRGQATDRVGPSVPVEVLGFSSAPVPGDTLVVVEDEARAREVAEYRERKEKERRAALSRKSTLDLLMSGKDSSSKKSLSLIIKSDVQGSSEAIIGAFDKFQSDEVSVKVVHTGVGAVNESDITLAQTTHAFIVGFNVRANPQAADLAQREGIEVRYYSVIYNVIDDVKKILSGLLEPELHEEFLGYADVRDVFNISRVGRIAGCYVTKGEVRRGAKVRLLRDNVVIHEGALKTLKRFKEEVKEVKEGYECGMSFENYNDIKVGDVIECFEIKKVARTIK